MSKPTFSVVIPIWKRSPDLLARLLATLVNQTYPLAEIIVSDTNPSDSEFLHVDAVCGAYPTLVTHTRMPMDEFSISKAMNLGIRRTKPSVDYVATTGSEMLFSRNYFETIAATITPNRITQACCGSLKPSVIVPDNPHSDWDNLCLAIEPRSNINISPGTIICATRAWWFNVRGYDEDILFHWPDSDMVRRAMMSGLQQMSIPWSVAQALHQWHPNYGIKEPGKSIYELRLDPNIARNLEKWGGRP